VDEKMEITEEVWSSDNGPVAWSEDGGTMIPGIGERRELAEITEDGFIHDGLAFFAGENKHNYLYRDYMIYIKYNGNCQ